MMSDAEFAARTARADRFIAAVREMIEATAVDPSSLCAEEHRRELQRFAATVDRVPFVEMCNLAKLNEALRGGLLDMIKMQLKYVGSGPALDYPSAAEISGGVRSLAEIARRRRMR